MQKIKSIDHWERGDFDKLKDSLSKDDSQKRHDIRYAMFRCQNERGGGAKAEKKHWEIAKMILAMEGAENVENWADGWDIGAVNPKIQIVKRLWSIYQEHSQLMRRVTVVVEKGDTPETLAQKANDILQSEKKAKKKVKDLKAKEEEAKRSN